MNDYKELIVELKELSDEEKEFASNSGDIYCAEMLALAADVIEQLVKEGEYIPTNTLRKYHAWLLEEYLKNPTSENLHSIDMAISWLKAYADYKCVNVNFCD